jgi:hypothetical protein
MSTSVFLVAKDKPHKNGKSEFRYSVRGLSISLTFYNMILLSTDFPKINSARKYLLEMV